MGIQNEQFYIKRRTRITYSYRCRTQLPRFCFRRSIGVPQRCNQTQLYQREANYFISVRHAKTDGSMIIFSPNFRSRNGLAELSWRLVPSTEGDSATLCTSKKNGTGVASWSRAIPATHPNFARTGGRIAPSSLPLYATCRTTEHQGPSSSPKGARRSAPSWRTRAQSFCRNGTTEEETVRFTHPTPLAPHR